MGDAVSLSKYEGKFVLLVFLRYAGCPWCNLTIHRLSLESKLLAKQGCDIIAFVQSSKDNIMSNVYDKHVVKPPFPIIADPNMDIYKRYGVQVSAMKSFQAVARSIAKIPHWVHAVKEHGFKQQKLDGNLFVVPAMFLVKSSPQTIVFAAYGSNFYDHETFATVYRHLVFREP